MMVFLVSANAKVPGANTWSYNSYDLTVLQHYFTFLLDEPQTRNEYEL